MTTRTADIIDTVTEVASGGVDPLHEVTDAAKVTALAADMAEHGWRGAPIVVAGEQALTGVHRIAAAVQLWNHDGIDIPVPRVEVSDLCQLYGLDWASILMDDYDGDTYRAASTLRELLPREVVDYLGYDVDGTL